MLDKGQDQKVEGGAVAIQAAGNVTIGASITEMRQTFELLMQANFPVLRDEARATAQAAANEFIAKMERKIIDSAEKVDVARFSDPDVQSTMNDAVQASARRGAAANQDILCELVAQRVARDGNSFKDIVLSEAVQVAPKLTPSLISTVTLIHFVRSVKITTESPLQALEFLAMLVLPLCLECDGVSEAQKAHIQYAGVGSFLSLLSSDPYELLQRQYPEMGLPDSAAMKTEIQKLPNMAQLCELYGRNQLGTITLTSVGQAIALANLVGRIPMLDFNIWIR